MLCVAVLLVATVAQAADPNVVLEPMKWSATAFGSNDMIGLRLERLGERTGIGPEFMWKDGLTPGDVEAWGLGGFAHYDLLKDGTIKILSYEVPTTIYAGARIGVLYTKETDAVPEKWDAQAGLVLGTLFGDAVNQVGFEAWVGATPALWNEFASTDPDAGVTVVFVHRWP
jgi:hypothetical protein